MTRRFGLSVRDVRTLAIGASVVLSTLVFGRFAPGVRGWMAYQVEASDAATRRLAFVERLLVAQDSLREADLVAAESLAALDARLIPAASPDEGGALLLAVVERYAEAARMRLSSTAVQAESTFAGSYARVAVRAYGVTDVQGLSTWLANVEQGEPLLRVGDITVTQPEPTADERLPENLRVEVLVHALVRRVSRDSSGSINRRAP